MPAMTWLAAIVAAASGGCVATGLYETPDILAPHTYELEVVPEAWSLDRSIGSDPYLGPQSEQDQGAGGIPTIIARFGLENGTDIGLGLFRFDVKVPLGSNDWFAVATDPIVRVVKTQEADPGLVAELPLIFGVRLGSRVTIVANGGLAFVSIEYPELTDEGGNGRINWVALRGGAGVRVRITDAISVQPEVAYLHAIGAGRMDWISGGIAVAYRG
jgi:hypothetical protein